MNKITKEERKKIVISSIIGAIINTIILYLILGPYNDDIVVFMKALKETNLVLKTCLIFLPISFCFLFGIKLGSMSEQKSKKK